MISWLTFKSMLNLVLFYVYILGDRLVVRTPRCDRSNPGSDSEHSEHIYSIYY